MIKELYIYRNNNHIEFRGNYKTILSKYNKIIEAIILICENKLMQFFRLKDENIEFNVFNNGQKYGSIRIVIKEYNYGKK